MIREVRIESVVVRVDPSSESGFARSPTVWLLGVFTFPGTFWCSSPCFTILNEKVLSFPPFSEKVEDRSWENLMKNWWKWIYRRELNLQLHPICDPTNPAFHDCRQIGTIPRIWRKWEFEFCSTGAFLLQSISPQRLFVCDKTIRVPPLLKDLQHMLHCKICPPPAPFDQVCRFVQPDQKQLNFF